jgi:hypothetical protein
MGLPINVIVGGNASATSGTTPQILRCDPTGAMATAKVHGDYYEACVRKTMFSGSTLTGVTTTVGFATTHTGFCLSNPIGSTVNLVLNKVKYATLVQQSAALVFGLQTGYSASTNVTQTTPLVPLSNFVGQPAGQGLIASAVTLPIAPTRLMLLDTLLTGALTVGINGGNFLDMQGSIVVPPGGFVATYTSAASVATSLVFGMTWEEVPVTI